MPNLVSVLGRFADNRVAQGTTTIPVPSGPTATGTGTEWTEEVVVEHQVSELWSVLMAIVAFAICGWLTLLGLRGLRQLRTRAKPANQGDDNRT